MSRRILFRLVIEGVIMWEGDRLLRLFREIEERAGVGDEVKIYRLAWRRWRLVDKGVWL